MLDLPGKLLRAVSDVTVGTAIVMVHVMLADRDRSGRVADLRPSARASTSLVSDVRSQAAEHG